LQITGPTHIAIFIYSLLGTKDLLLCGLPWIDFHMTQSPPLLTLAVTWHRSKITDGNTHR